MKFYDLSRRMCEWDELDAWQRKAGDMLARGEAGRVPPFLLLAMPDISAAQQRECADLWMYPRLADSHALRTAHHFDFARAPHAKIRLGYLSNDFHDHATAHLLVEMIEAHDRARFEVSAYSYGADDARPMRQRLTRAFDRFVDIEALPHDAAARAIHRDEVDILIDLKGYTRGTRTAILTYRPAPVQVNFLGYPGTLGGDFCDYIITDRFLTPPASAAAYSEHFAYLPHSYQPHSRHGEAGPPPTRAEAGLPARGTVLCCFNQASKITPAVFDLWCRLLADCPESVLWLLADELAEGNLRNRAHENGISPARLVFAPHAPQAAHLARLQLADLVLDTLPFNAHTTASDALWAGVPLVTCAGSTFASRVAGSLLNAVGLPELVTHDLDAYYALAHELLQDPTTLARVRARLAANRATCALFDVPRYTRDIEALFESMWARHCAGVAPGAIG